MIALVSDAAATVVRLGCRQREHHHPFAWPRPFSAGHQHHDARGTPARWRRAPVRMLRVSGSTVSTSTRSPSRRRSVDSGVGEADGDDPGVGRVAAPRGQTGSEHPDVGEGFAGAGRPARVRPAASSVRCSGARRAASPASNSTSPTSSSARTSPGVRSRRPRRRRTRCVESGSPRASRTTASQGQRGGERPAGERRPSAQIAGTGRRRCGVEPVGRRSGRGRCDDMADARSGRGPWSTPSRARLWIDDGRCG